MSIVLGAVAGILAVAIGGKFAGYIAALVFGILGLVALAACERYRERQKRRSEPPAANAPARPVEPLLYRWFRYGGQFERMPGEGFRYRVRNRLRSGVLSHTSPPRALGV